MEVPCKAVWVTDRQTCEQILSTRHNLAQKKTSPVKNPTQINKKMEKLHFLLATNGVSLGHP